jgi:hypothetical protein
MSKEEKMKRLLEMQEHPERYTDEEIRQLMADEECRQLYDQMVRATDAMFEARRFDSEEAGVKRRVTRTPFMKVAASIIGVLMLSGITYAAVRWLTASPSPSQGESMETHISSTSSDGQTPALSSQEEPVDEKVVYENAELATLLAEMGAYYNYKVTYKNEEVKHIRLYFTWDKASPIDDVVEVFNKFERFHITQEKPQMQLGDRQNAGMLIVE